MAAQSFSENSALAAQRKVELLIAKVFIVGGLTTLLLCLWDMDSGLTTPWDNYGIPITSSIYFVSGLIIYFKPERIRAATVLSLIFTSIYQEGVLFWAIHFHSPASFFSAASSGPYFPIVYVVLFIALPQGAARLSWFHCLGFFLQFLINNTWLADPSPSSGRIDGEHLLLSFMFANPVYILALSYIVQLRERLNQERQEFFQSKAAFLGMLSHEIRNLLQTMVSAIDLLDLRLSEPAERKSVARLQTAATQLQTYLVDINELTKLENPEVRVQTSRVNIPALLSDIREEWLPKTELRGLRLEVGIEEQIVPQSFTITTDEGRLRQILANLVSNALKYTEKGSVTIRASLPTGNTPGIRLEVADTGIGIDAKYLDKIFQPYVRLNNPRLGRSEGSGLGLTIVARLVESIGGSVNVDSEPERGTRFTITLPEEVRDHAT
jgi:signal transduction histidine kinase